MHSTKGCCIILRFATKYLCLFYFYFFYRHKMRGMNTVWVPGCDHAGIATQAVVERQLLAAKGKRRADMPREQFMEMISAWKNDNENRIYEQLQTLGLLLDWDRKTFTLDPVSYIERWLSFRLDALAAAIRMLVISLPVNHVFFLHKRSIHFVHPIARNFSNLNDILLQIEILY